MGYSICNGNIQNRHERRTCDGCDRCPKCNGFAMIRMYCWLCCGPVYSCPSCANRLAQHIVSKGPPRREMYGEQAINWAADPRIVRGYNRAVKLAA